MLVSSIVTKVIEQHKILRAKKKETEMRYAFVNKCYNSKIGVRKTLTVCRYSNRKNTCI